MGLSAAVLTAECSFLEKFSNLDLSSINFGFVDDLYQIII